MALLTLYDYNARLGVFIVGTLIAIYKSISPALDTEADTGLISKYETPSATGRRCADV